MVADKQKRVAVFLPLSLLLISISAGAASPYTFRFILFCLPRYELVWAAAKGDVAGINHALSRGASINAPDGYAGRTALMGASMHGQTKAVTFLIARGADINTVDETGKTARQLAENGKHLDTARLFAGR